MLATLLTQHTSSLPDLAAAMASDTAHTVMQRGTTESRKVDASSVPWPYSLEGDLEGQFFLELAQKVPSSASALSNAVPPYFLPRSLYSYLQFPSFSHIPNGSDSATQSLAQSLHDPANLPLL